MLLYRLAWCIYWQCVAGDGIGSLTACSYWLAVCGQMSITVCGIGEGDSGRGGGDCRASGGR